MVTIPWSRNPVIGVITYTPTASSNVLSLMPESAPQTTLIRSATQVNVTLDTLEIYAISAPAGIT